ncbi:MAG: MarR family transcriptional regulator [Flammeovirgaceae bacterium]|nr:MarR family transcriptional regulator [Flammeovirgaceae bacterium]
MKIEDEIKQSKFKSQHQKAAINILYTANWLQSKQQEFFKSLGITFQQFNILRILRGQHPKSISATEIKSRMIDRNSDVSRLLDRLAAKKLIEKKTCPIDKRAADIFITEEGLRLLERTNDLKDEAAILLTPEEAEKLSELLDKCRG